MKLTEAEKQARADAQRAAFYAAEAASKAGQNIQVAANRAYKAVYETAEPVKKSPVDLLWEHGSKPVYSRATDAKQNTYVSIDDVIRNTVSDIQAAKQNVAQKQQTVTNHAEATQEREQARQQWGRLGEDLWKREQNKAESELRNAELEYAKLRLEQIPEEDQELFRQYAKSKDFTSSVFGQGNVIEWYKENRDNDNAKRVLEEKYGEDFAVMADAFLEQQRKSEAEQAQADAASTTEKHPWMQNIFGVPERVLGGVEAIPQRVVDVVTQNQKPSQYTANSYLANYGNAVLDKTVDMIEGDGGAIRKTGSFAYQGITGLADSMGRMAIGGGPVGGALLSAGNTLDDAISDAMNRGATPQQAYTLAITNAAIEFAAEKIPLDNLLKIARGGGKKTLAMNMLKQAGIEIGEEEVTLLGNVLADAAIMQEKSQYNLNVAQYMTIQGMDMAQAKQQASKDLLVQALETAAVSGISGIAGGFGAARTAAFADNNNMGKHTGEVPVDVATERAEVPTQQLQPFEERTASPNPVSESVPTDFVTEVARKAAEAVQPTEHTMDTPERSALDKAIQSLMEDNLGTQIGETATAEKSVTNPGASDAAPVDTTQKPATESVSSVPNVAQTNPNATDTTGMQNTPSGDVQKSRSVTNTGLNSRDADIRAGYQETLQADPTLGDYQVKHNDMTLATAEARTSTPERVRNEYAYFMRRASDWTPENAASGVLTAEDVVTAKLVSRALFRNGDVEGHANMERMLAATATNTGQVSQAFSIIGTMRDAADPATAVERAANVLYKMNEEESTFRKGKDGQTYEQWRKDIVKNISQIGMEIDRVQDGDSDAMREIIRQIARARKTTAWFGISGKMTKIADTVLNKLDFDDLKKIANTQVASMADDYRRRTAVDVSLTLRKQAMLSNIKTFSRNIIGNTSVGIMDSASDSTAGRTVDALLSKITGKRTVGGDFLRGKTYMTAAKDAAQFAALCVELDIPIETTVDASYQSATGNGRGGKYIGRTFRPNGNTAMRALYAYQKYMSYALEVSDKIFEGGTSAVINASLRNLKNANLTDAEIQQLSEYTANRRTFKDATWEDSNGNTHGAVLSRATVGAKNFAERQFGTTGKVVADMSVPFASVPSNVVQTYADYTHGVAKGTFEIASIIRDAKAGKEINVARQRQAVTDFGRGVTGTALIGLFTAATAHGIIRVNDAEDKDKKAIAQAEGRNGAQISWDALYRAMIGESPEWQNSDIISRLDSLEPFNTLAYLGNELSQEETIQDILKAYPGASFKSTMQSFMDSPFMSSLKDITDGIYEAVKADTDEERLGVAAKTVGNVASSFIPQYVRQTAQYTDGFYRDTRGQSPLETAINETIAALPGFSKTLPKKISGLGEEQKRDNWMETFFDSMATKAYQKNEIIGYLDNLNGRTGAASIYPDRQAPMSISVRGDTIALDGQQRETYQKTYGEKNNALYSGLINYPGFSELPEDIQINAFEKAKSYATKFAKASVADYRDVPSSGTDDLVKGIVNDSVNTVFTRAFDNLSESWKFGYDDSRARDAVEQAYIVYDALLPEQKKAFGDESSGRTKYYLDARNAGISTDTFANLYQQYQDIGKSDMDTTEKAYAWATVLEKSVDNGVLSEKQKNIMRENLAFRYSMTAETERFDGMISSGIQTDKAKAVIDLLDGVKGTGSWDMERKEYRVTDIDKLTAIANCDLLTEREKDIAMKEYMPDYDPKASKPDKTELKYDTIRGIGFSAREYVQLSRLYTNGKERGGKGTKNRIIQGFQNTFGLDYETASALYGVYDGSYFKK